MSSAPQAQPPPHSPPSQPRSPTDTSATTSASEIQREPCDLEKHGGDRKDSHGVVISDAPNSAAYSADLENGAGGLQRRGTDSSILGRFTRALSGLSGKSGEADAPIEHQPEDIDYHPPGYPRLGAFLNSDENFLMCRRYGFLHTRVMLYKQDELRALEEDLMSLDTADAEADPRSLKSRERDDRRPGAERKELIETINQKLKEYDDCVMRARSMASLPLVTDRNYNSVSNYVGNNAPLCARERDFLSRRQDFVALVDPKEGSWFDAAIEDLLTAMPFAFARLVFSDPAQRRSTRDGKVFLYSKLRIDYFARIMIALLAVGLLMAPVVVLFMHDESAGIKVTVVLLFTLFFAAALSVFTKAKRHEVFAATAAYCAVLVVFLGNFN